MKKALTLVVLIVAPVMAFAQGTVVFNNSGSSLVQQWTSIYDWTLISVPESGGYVMLITAPVGTALHPLGTYSPSGFVLNFSSLSGFLSANPGWSAISTTPILPTAVGQFNGGTVTIPPPSASGTNAWYAILGWTGSYTTFDAAIAAGQGPGGSFLGMSAVATTATGDPLTPVSLSTTFGGMALEGFFLSPEPSTFALPGLGAVMLMLFHRRR